MDESRSSAAARSRPAVEFVAASVLRDEACSDRLHPAVPANSAVTRWFSGYKDMLSLQELLVSLDTDRLTASLAISFTMTSFASVVAPLGPTWTVSYPCYPPSGIPPSGLIASGIPLSCSGVIPSGVPCATGAGRFTF